MDARHASIDPETGAIGRATLIASPDRPGERGRRPGLESTVRVEFALDKTLGLLVPRELVELLDSQRAGRRPRPLFELQKVYDSRTYHPVSIRRYQGS